MADYNKLVGELLGDSASEAIAASNPLYGGRDIAGSIGQRAVQLVSNEPTRYETKDVALATGLSGLVQGLFGGAGDIYQEKLQDRYNTAIGDIIAGRPASVESTDLSQDLFNLAKQKGGLFRKQQAINDIMSQRASKQKLSDRFQGKFIDQLFRTPTAGEAIIKDPKVAALYSKVLSAVADPEVGLDLTDEDRGAIAGLPANTREEITGLLKARNVGTREMARQAEKDTERAIEKRERAIPNTINIGFEAPVVTPQQVDRLRKQGEEMESLFTAIDSTEGANPFALTGIEAIVNNVGLNFIDAAITRGATDQRTDAPTRALLRKMTPSALVRGQIADTAIESITGRERKYINLVLKKVFSDAYEAKVEFNGLLIPGKEYDSNFINKLHGLYGGDSTPEEFAETLTRKGISWKSSGGQ